MVHLHVSQISNLLGHVFKKQKKFCLNEWAKLLQNWSLTSDA
jgi:hypothetical protein